MQFTCKREAKDNPSIHIRVKVFLLEAEEAVLLDVAALDGGARGACGVCASEAGGGAVEVR